MPRPTKKSKPYIVVFCEGESEQVYTDFLRKEFKDVASIKRPSSTGLLKKRTANFKRTKPIKATPKSQMRFGSFLMWKQRILAHGMPA